MMKNYDLVLLTALKSSYHCRLLISQFVDPNAYYCLVNRAYHGHTAALIDISPYKYTKLGPKGKKDHIHVAPTPDLFRGIFQGEATPEMGEKYALEVKKLIDQAQKDGRKVSKSID